MYKIYFELNVGMCVYEVEAQRVQEALGLFNKLNIKVDRVEFADAPELVRELP